MNAQHVVINPAPAHGPGALWQPQKGPELVGMLDRSRLEHEAAEAVGDEAVNILSRGVPPTGTGAQRRTGLVVGYVQSGKTLSFTAAVAAAHDNGIPLVILLTGTKRNLHRQTTERLERDLDVDRSGGGPWLMKGNPGDDSDTVAGVAATLRKWTAPAANPDNPFLGPGADEKRTVVLSVMKNSTRLTTARELVVRLKAQGIDFRSLAVLVVDDEADQAGLNARPGDEAEPTATYRAIRDLRDELPRHTYLEYTATPQAPLLLDLLDNLSPDFAVVLEPGAGYNGGKHFFEHQRETFVKTLPQTEADAAADKDDPVPPATMQHALASYLVASLLMQTRGVRQSSMLVHPSHKRDLHGRYAGWVHAMITTWRLALAEPGTERDEIVDGLIAPAYRNLAPGASDDPQTMAHLVEAVQHLLADLQVREVNAGTGAGTEIDWNAHRHWLLVGGNKLDRGYTVEGLVTTYMPRSTGGGQADTIQQRARFFGYKDDYDDLCRAWLTPTAIDIYDRYVEHEEALRAALEQVERSGESLKDWQRRMILDPKLKPCRANVISLAHVRERIRGDAWTRFDRLPPLSDEVHAENLARVQALRDKHGQGRRVDSRDPRDSHRTTVFRVPVAALVAELLDGWGSDELGRSTMNSLLLLLGARLDDAASLPADVYLMRDLLPRERSHNGATVSNLFEGHRPERRGDDFPGDLVFRTDATDVISVQVHNVTLRPRVNEPARPGCPALTVWVPKQLAADVIVGLE
jgi:hypothetical protein